MATIQSIETQPASYSAVKIRVNDAKAYNFGNTNGNEDIYNATDIEVNRPAVYNYPDAKELITYKMAQISKVDVPKSLPVPEPNPTTTEAEKNLAFHGVSFKAAPKEVEIVPSEDIKPDVDIQNVTANLSSSDYDVQTKQIKDILDYSNQHKYEKNPYITVEVFGALIDTIKKDNSNLEKASEEQNKARDKFRENLIAVDKAIADGVDPKDFKAPHEMTEEESKLALTPTPYEKAEHNKAGALIATAVLAKKYADDVEKQTGNIVPLTDLPGASAIVDTLRYSENPEVKMSALDSLAYIARPEYSEELSTILSLAAQDKDPKVAQYATILGNVLAEQQRSEAAEKVKP